ncbi:unnamed protein product [Ceratitis capitata]|uniref:(Mediterranean fruit fly) hypothetical protein n=1 Tax=Ceratitis capitata TaxID=7213 RepID=A0A811U3T8_CERCA|nr:unnamed protein product [Ceratitis capitata]
MQRGSKAHSLMSSLSASTLHTKTQGAPPAMWTVCCTCQQPRHLPQLVAWRCAPNSGSQLELVSARTPPTPPPQHVLQQAKVDQIK